MKPPKVSRLHSVWIALAVIAAIFVGAGIPKHAEFRFRAIDESEKQIKKVFADRGERVREFGKPDYSLGTVEIMARTDKARYIVTLRVTNAHWVSLTALNMAISPTVIISSIEEAQ